MQDLHEAVQLILQILSNPPWSGISSICALIGIPLAILLARQSKAGQLKGSYPRQIHTHFKKRDNNYSNAVAT